MIRKTVLALATVAIAATGSLTTANAGGYSGGYSFGTYEQAGYYGSHAGHKKHYRAHRKHCYWKKRKVIVGYDYDGYPRYRVKRIKVCSY